MTIEKILLEFSPVAENILPALKKINADFGFIDKLNAQKVADYFSTSLSKIYETASFYDAINIQKQPKVTIKVCFSTHCALKDAAKIITEIEKILQIKAGDTNRLNFKLERISCLGRCGEGPIVVVNDKIYEKVTVGSVRGILEEYM